MNLEEGRRSKERKIHTYYEIQNDRLKRRLKMCPRCGSFMALHTSNRARWTCGKCFYTEYTSKNDASL